MEKLCSHFMITSMMYMIAQVPPHHFQNFFISNPIRILLLDHGLLEQAPRDQPCGFETLRSASIVFM
jgi:hypothetical protein